MKKIILLFVFAVLYFTTTANNLNPAPVTLKGQVRNTKNEPVTGASVYVTELKTGAVTDLNGNYEIDNLPAKNLLIQVNSLGYKTIAEAIPLQTTQHKDFTLEETIIEINEVTITGQASAIKQSRTPSPVSVVSHATLIQTGSTNLIDAIASQPGISQLTTGSGISKPVIRGLGFNRIIVINDGVRQEGQQWGAEHGIEIDENDVDKVEILKGPASLLYGSDAMAGVINFMSAPVLPKGKKQLNLMGNYQTNNGLYGLSANFAGHEKSFIWDLRYSNKAAHDYRNRYDGYVFNSGFAENASSALLGINKAWGYTHLTLSAYNLTPGIVEGERDSASGKFIKEVAGTNGAEELIAGNPDFLSYKKQVPYQKISHYKAALNSNILIGNGFLKSTFGFQQNNRREYENVLAPDEYALYFKQNTLSYDVHYKFPEMKQWTLTAGVNGMYQHSMNLGDEFLIPEFRLLDAGVFAVFSKPFGKINISGGLRYDNRHFVTDALYLNGNEEVVNSGTAGAEEKFAAIDKNFGGWSGSMGATWEINKNWNTKLNVSRGYRAPNISEISSNGVHEGTLRYELGNGKLKSEQSLQLDYEIGFTNEHINAQLNLFSNYIDNFIYTSKLSSVNGGDSIIENVPVFQFNQNRVILNGGEFLLDIHPHPLDWLHIENSFSYVNGQFINGSDSTRYLPFSPAPRWTSTLRAEVDFHRKYLENTFFTFGFDYNLAQNHIFSAYNTETTTPAYFLLNASAGTDIKINRQKISLYVIAQNLTDVAYQSHLSRLKYAPENNATGRSGVYNMGRNISVKVIVPVSL